MQRQSIIDKGISYLVSPDDKIPLSRCTQVIVRGRVIDNITKQPLAVPVTIRTNEPFSIPVVIWDGIFGLIVMPRNIFPWLATHNYAVDMTFSADGYAPLQLSALIPHDDRTITGQDPFPSTFFSLSNVHKLYPGDTLLIGNPGPNLRCVLILSVDTPANKVIVKPELGKPELLRLYVNEPAVPVVPNDFRSQGIGDISLFPL